jgi:uncharacterized protein YbjT (DUF2867 family)
MKVFLTGGTGFVGSEVLGQLLSGGHTVRCLVRGGSEGKLPIREGVEVRIGDVVEAQSLEGILEGCDAVIHLVGIIREIPSRGVTFSRLHFEATRNMVEAAGAQGVKRYLQMSANGTRPEASSSYHRSKWQAEEAVRNSGLDWTIFRPSLIFGPDDEFVNTLAGLVRKLPLVPVFGDGSYRMTPVAVQDVARSFVAALKKKGTVGQVYHCCGPDTLTYDEVLDRVGKAIGKERVRKIHHPVCLVKPFIALFESIPQFPITRTQLTMLLEGNVCDPEPWAKTFGIKPLPFFEGIRKYLQL